MLIHCHGDPQVIVRRYRERAERGERHPGHHDLQLVDAVSEAIGSGAYEPLNLSVPTLRVDTTVPATLATLDTPGTRPDDHPYAPSFADILAFIQDIAPQS
ncbi:MAG: hypothetical protein AVDCRST_MAG77-3052 [uncultured Chloroflexi bacterium]|uniref:Uncharacterized protein n=1 Tax=uncultured Chloroflexota bacterium TaxID=166587 RepID=A0A6J4J3L8_9CHLR|nr:MAG: hypothetical protein AVDCRST_MAG77-3052 [uncultured Chloroflexota bacterium]